MTASRRAPFRYVESCNRAAGTAWTRRTKGARTASVALRDLEAMAAEQPHLAFRIVSGSADSGTLTVHYVYDATR